MEEKNVCIGETVIVRVKHTLFHSSAFLPAKRISCGSQQVTNDIAYHTHLRGYPEDTLGDRMPNYMDLSIIQEGIPISLFFPELTTVSIKKKMWRRQ